MSAGYITILLGKRSIYRYIYCLLKKGLSEFFQDKLIFCEALSLIRKLEDCNVQYLPSTEHLISLILMFYKCNSVLQTGLLHMLFLPCPQESHFLHSKEPRRDFGKINVIEYFSLNSNS